LRATLRGGFTLADGATDIWRRIQLDCRASLLPLLHHRPSHQRLARV